MNNLSKAICSIACIAISAYAMAQQPSPLTPPVAPLPAGTPPPANAQVPRNGPPRIQVKEYQGLKGDLGAHDPVMIKAGDTYYVLTTGIGVKISKDRINWASAPGLWDRGFKFAWWNNDIPERVGIWAPDIQYRDGKYHLYYSVSAWMNFNSSIGYATNVTLDKNDSRYKWEDQGQVISFKNGGEGVNVIDPNIFYDKDGKLWLVYGSYKSGLRMVELNPKTGKLLTEKPNLVTLTPHLGEGSYIIKGPEYYYIFASRGRCCAGLESTYQIVMGRSRKVTGPYLSKEGDSWTEDKYSVFLAGNEDEPGRGHNGIFAEGDSTYMVYHAYAKAANGQSLLVIKPLYMDEQGWPTLDPTKKLFVMDKFERKAYIGK